MSTIYLPVQPRINLTSQQRAHAISCELYNLKVPKSIQAQDRATTMLLTCIQHPLTNQWACVGDTDLTIQVHPQKDVTALVALFPQLSTDERSAMTYYISTSNTVHFSYLMPSDSEVLTESEAISAGWITTEI